MSDEVLKLAVQKKGRLTDKTIELLKTCDIDIDNYGDRLHVSAKNFELELLLLRDDDIPEYVQDGVADLGIVGENVIAEKCANVTTLHKLGFGKCQLMFAIPENEQLENIKEINGKRIATSYPNIVKNYFKENDIQAKVIEISGSVEIAPALGIADMICDIVSTGNTLRMNKLKKSFPVYDSQAVLIGSNSMKENPEKMAILEDLLRRINSVQRAKKSKYLMLNAPKANVGEIAKVIPSLKSPTIVPLADPELVAVHAVVTTQQFWEIADSLKKLDASGILLLPIESIIP